MQKAYTEGIVSVLPGCTEAEMENFMKENGIDILVF